LIWDDQTSKTLKIDKGWSQTLKIDKGESKILKIDNGGSKTLVNQSINQFICLTWHNLAVVKC